MADDNIGQFLWHWKLKGICLKFFVEEKIPYPNISIEARSLGDSKWNLELSCISNTAENKKHLTLKLRLIDYDEKLIHGKLDLNFEYKLLSPEGEVFVASDLLNGTFDKGTASAPYELIEMDRLMNHRLTWSENSFTLCCYMTHKGSPLMFNETQGIGCEIKTILCAQLTSSAWRLKFKNHEHWSVCRRVYGLIIPLDITFRHVYDEIQIEMLSSIKDDWEHTIYCSIFLLNNIDGNKIFQENELYTFSKKNKIWMFPKKITFQHLLDAHLGEEKIRIQCSFFLMNSSMVSYSKNKKKQETKDAQLLDADCNLHLQEDFRNLLVDKHFTDVKLRADNEIFHAHKGVLAARSPVFSAMFRHGMVGSNSGVIDILDVESESLEAFLEFIYTGEIRELDKEKALTMLIMADKYHVSSLKEKSSKFLMAALAVNNACQILVIADSVNCDVLKSNAMKYIAEHFKEVLTSREWPKLMKSNFSLAIQAVKLIR